MKRIITILSIFLAINNLYSQELKEFNKRDLIEDFDILTNALEEAHTGLFWYTSKSDYTGLKKEIINKINESESLTELQFYNIIAPIIDITNEDHCDISLSEKTSSMLYEKGKCFPFLVKFIDNKPFLYNSNKQDENNINGYELLEINGVKIDSIIEKIFKTFASDGYITTSKYRWLDDVGFSKLYAITFDWKADSYKIKVKSPNLNIKNLTIKSCTFNVLANEFINFINKTKKDNFPVEFKIENGIAKLIVQTFNSYEYKGAKINFHKFIRSSFKEIRQKKINNLIIDVRANGGGTEGYEDFLFSFLTNKPYTKYKYVETNNNHYSFYQYTDYSDAKDQKEFEKLINKEFDYNKETGKFIRKTKIEKPAKLQKKPYLGNLYILAGGVTYSGGAEFCSLVKNNTKATFIGEEVGGGYYGNTSGYSFTLTLPNTNIDVEIPIVRFVLNVDGQEKGTGVKPDYKVEPTMNDFLNGIDTEMNFTIDLINK